MSAALSLLALESYAELRRNVRRAVLSGGTVSTTTLGTERAPSIIERTEPESRAQVIARLIVHREARAAELRALGRDGMAEAFEESLPDLRAQLRAVVRSESQS